LAWATWRVGAASPGQRALIEQGLHALGEGEVQIEPGYALFYALDYFAIVAAAQGHRPRAARLAAACTTLRDAHRTPRHLSWQGTLRRESVPLERPTTDPEATAWDEGRTTTLEQTVQYALRDDAG
jgi:hypothetical protein